MAPLPQGTLQCTPGGVDLRLTRTFDAPVADVWASLTESDRTAAWFGPWDGESGAGNVVHVRMVHEEGAPTSDMTIVACDPPRHLELTTTDDAGAWHLSVELREDAGTTELALTHHAVPIDAVGEVGPGWEYYLDMLVAARGGAALPSFDDYYPAQRAHYLALAAAL